MGVITAFLVALLIALIVRWLATEIGLWHRPVCDWLVKVAAAHLPAEERVAVASEWLAQRTNVGVSLCSLAAATGKHTERASVMMQHPTKTNFKIEMSDAAVIATFEPTKSSYTFLRLADPEDIARHGPILPEPDNVRHAGPTGDTGDYPSHEVQRTAYDLAVRAARKS